MEWVVHNLANALSILGHNVVVLTKRVKQEDLEREKLYKLEKIGFAFRGATRIGLNFISFLYCMDKVVKKYNVEVINFHSAAYSGVYALSYKKFVNGDIPLVATLHGADVQMMPEINYGYCLDKKWRKKIVNVLKESDAITAKSESIKNDVKNLVPEVIDRVYDVPNGIWIDEFSSHKIKQDIREKFNLPKNSKVIISVGRNHIKKGFEHGIKAMKIICERFLDVYYVIIGKDTEKLYPLVVQLGLKDRIVLAGEIKNKDELIDCYKSSDIYLSPSLIEGFSSTNLEAMASGLPCVISDVPGNRDVVKNNCGILVKPRSSEAIAKTVIEILNNTRLRNTLKQNALREIKNYDWLSISDKYVKIYEEVTQRE